MCIRARGVFVCTKLSYIIIEQKQYSRIPNNIYIIFYIYANINRTCAAAVPVTLSTKRQ